MEGRSIYAVEAVAVSSSSSSHTTGAVPMDMPMVARAMSGAMELVQVSVRILKDEAPRSMAESVLRKRLVNRELEEYIAVQFNSSVGYGEMEEMLRDSLGAAMAALRNGTLDVKIDASGQLIYVGPAAGVKCRADLLEALSSRVHGTKFGDLRGAYDGITCDVDRLWKRGRLVAIQHPRRTDSTGGSESGARSDKDKAAWEREEASRGIASSLKGLVLFPRVYNFGYQYCLTRLPGLHRLVRSEEQHVTTTCDLRDFVRRGDAVVVAPVALFKEASHSLPGFGTLDASTSKLLVERAQDDDLVFRVDNFSGVRHVDVEAGESANGEADQVAKLARYSVASGCELDMEGRERPRTIKGERGRGDSSNPFTAVLMPLDRKWCGEGAGRRLKAVQPEEDVALFRFGVANDLRSLWGATIEKPGPWPDEAEMRAELAAIGQATMGVEGGARRRPSKGRRKRKRRGAGPKTLAQTHLIGTALGDAILRGDM